MSRKVHGDDDEDGQGGAPRDGQDLDAGEDRVSPGEHDDAPDDDLDGEGDDVSRLRGQLRRERQRKRSAQSRLRQQDEEIGSLREQMAGLAARLDQRDAGELLERSSGAISAAEAEVAKAIEDGDAPAQARAQSKLMQARLDATITKARVDAAKRASGEEDQPEPGRQQQRGTQQQPSAAAADWLKRNAWYGEGGANAKAAYGILNGMVQDEDYDPEDPETYAELDRKMSRIAPELYKKRDRRASTAGDGRETRGGGDRPAEIPAATLEVFKQRGYNTKDPKVLEQIRHSVAVARNGGVEP